MSQADLSLIIEITMKSIFFLAFVYLDRKTWSWKKLFCVSALVSLRVSYTDVSGYTMLYLLLMYCLSVIGTFQIIQRANKTSN
ncbi:MAG TPA: hypothetical protein VIG45_03070 [Erysipelothrix sp.]